MLSQVDKVCLHIFIYNVHKITVKCLVNFEPSITSVTIPFFLSFASTLFIIHLTPVSFKSPLLSALKSLSITLPTLLGMARIPAVVFLPCPSSKPCGNSENTDRLPMSSVLTVANCQRDFFFPFSDVLTADVWFISEVFVL